jgi:2-hydroxychromene-2-carboxylate isomerase
VIDVLHFSDPGCPWAWSASPALAVLRWRYGDQLDWRNIVIGLTETGTVYEQRGYSGRRQALGYRTFRDRGMPFATAPREAMHGTWPMCRAIVAARLTVPDREWAVFRALQVAQFTTTLNLETQEGIATALHRVPGLDVDELLAAADSPETEEAFQADLDEARTAGEGPTWFMDRSATAPDGRIRFTAPSLVFIADDGRRLEAGGFQPIEANDVCIAKLDPTLERRGPGTDVAEILGEFPDGLFTAEVAAIMTPNNQAFDRDAAEDALIDLAADGGAARVALGNDALWAVTPARLLAAA